MWLNLWIRDREVAGSSLTHALRCQVQLCTIRLCTWASVTKQYNLVLVKGQRS